MLLLESQRKRPLPRLSLVQQREEVFHRRTANQNGLLQRTSLIPLDKWSLERMLLLESHTVKELSGTPSQCTTFSMRCLGSLD